MDAQFELERPDTSKSASAVLSIYLNVDQSVQANRNRGFETALNAKLKTIEQNLEKASQREELAASAAAVRSFLANYQPSGKGIVIFANATGLLNTMRVSVDLETEARWDMAAHVEPYLAFLDDFERCIVVVTNTWHTRVLSVFLSTVECTEEVKDLPETTHVHTAGMDHLYSQPGFQRRADEKMQAHLKNAVRAIEKMFRANPANRLILTGNMDAVHQLFRLLPRTLKPKVIGTLHIEITATDKQILEAVKTIRDKAERHFETESVERLIVRAAKGERAVAGLANTLGAFRDRRVAELLYADGAIFRGLQCETCNALFTHDAGVLCVECMGMLRDADDLLDLLLAQATSNRVRIEKIHGPAVEKLQTVGGMGALLRF